MTHNSWYAIKPNQTKSYIYVYKLDLALDNPQWSICHKTEPNQISYIYVYKQDLALDNPQ